MGIITALLAAGVAIARWNGAHFEWWQTLLGIVGLLALAIVAFALWIADEHETTEE